MVLKDPANVIAPLVAPIYKIGLIAVRDAKSEDPQVLLVQVKAKDPAEQHQVDFGLPKGTRRYTDPATGEMKDARDMFLASKYREQLEPVQETLFQEGETEAGIPRAELAKRDLYCAGMQTFISRRSGTTEDIEFYATEVDASFIGKMEPKADDMHARAWVPMSELRAMEEAGKVNAAYVAAAEAAVAGLRDKTLKPANFARNPPLAR
jgi:hypothetical protein